MTHRIDILLTSELAGGMSSFSHEDVEVRFHRMDDLWELPLLEGALWAFVDWVLPEMSGLEVCRRLRGDPITAEAHITMVLDENDQEARRRALRHGADDYIMGPLNRTAVLDRVLSLNFLAEENGRPHAIQQGQMVIDLAAHRACWDGTPIPLAPNELGLLRYFVEHSGRVLSRQQLIAGLGKQEPLVDERTVDVWIGRLRRALRTVGAGSQLRTVRSLGYVYDV